MTANAIALPITVINILLFERKHSVGFVIVSFRAEVMLIAIPSGTGRILKNVSANWHINLHSAASLDKNIHDIFALGIF